MAEHKLSNMSLKINDIVNLNKTRDNDLATLNKRIHPKNEKKVFNISEGININEVKKAKKYMEQKKCINILL